MIDAVNPRIITWARERCGFSIEEFAAKVKREPDEVRKWEAGEKAPAYSTLEALAYRHLKIPLAVFFFPEPPAIDDPVANFRRLPEFEIERLSADTRDKIRLAQCYQNSLFELLANPISTPIHHRCFANPSSLPNLASKIRSFLGITLDMQFGFNRMDTAFKAWRHVLEESGIFTFKDSFQDRFISGFCLLSKEFPVIMVNNSNAFARQIFTLAHELGHILLGLHGVTDIDESYFDHLSPSDRRAEIACNRFAANLLVPRQAFLSEFEGLPADDPEIISKIATRFSVSREVILRRLLDESIIDSTLYSNMASRWNRDYLRHKKDITGGNWYLTKLSYLGEGFTQLALESHHRGKLPMSELASHLNIKARNIPRLQSYLGW